jgi:hypothetical protein
MIRRGSRENRGAQVPPILGRLRRNRLYGGSGDLPDPFFERFKVPSRVGSPERGTSFGDPPAGERSARPGTRFRAVLDRHACRAELGSDETGRPLRNGRLLSNRQSALLPSAL